MRTYITITILCLTLFILGGCAMNKAQTGAGVGALGGAVVGSMTGGGEVLPTVIGAGVGLAAGYIVGNEMDKYDKKEVTTTLENTPSGETRAWKNPDTGKVFRATPKKPTVKTTKGKDMICRDIKLESWVDGDKKLTSAEACRVDGKWVLKD